MPRRPRHSLVRRAGIPAFAYGPGRLDISHGPQEFIDEQAMLRAAVAYALFAGDLLD